MSAEAWGTTELPLYMLHLLRAAGLPEWDERKTCLIAGHCLGRALGRASDPPPQFAAVERLAGPGDRGELCRAWAELYEGAMRDRPPGHIGPYRGFQYSSDRPTRGALVTMLRETAVAGAGLAESVPYEWQCRLLREVLGNPFRPAALDPAWLTSDVRALAEGMYARGDFGAMPILADALQDASCDSEEVLSHCRRPGEHVRGCWVVDLLLGKG